MNTNIWTRPEDVIISQQAMPGMDDPRSTSLDETHQTDLGNAERLARRHGLNLRFASDLNRFFVWDGQRWRADDTGIVMTWAKDTVRAISSEAADAPRGMGDEIRDHALRSESKRALEAMIELVKTEPGIPLRKEELDADPWLLNCKNGTLELRTGTLRDADRNDLITKLVPVNYDPKAQCPAFLAFLGRVMDGHDEMIAYLRRATGYALTGDTSEEVFFFLYGTGANGKSTFLEVIRNVVGDYGMTASFGTFLTRKGEGPRNDLARLHNARFVTASEASAGTRLDESVIKQLTGRDHVSARFLYREEFEFAPQFKLFLAANHKPTITGRDEGIWRRIKLIPFSVEIPPGERDHHLGENLLAERPGILAWVVQGCLEWQSQGLGEPPAVQEATGAYREAMDPLRDFLADCCVVGSTMRVAASNLYAAYKEWCGEAGETPVSQKKLGEMLDERGFTAVRSATERQRRGVGLRATSGERDLPMP